MTKTDLQELITVVIKQAVSPLVEKIKRLEEQISQNSGRSKWYV